MDIQKEREAFEKFFYQNCLVQWEKDMSEMLFQKLESGDYEYVRLQSSWLSWQAAKAQAVQEGFVLVPKEPTPKMIDSTWHHDDEIQEMSHNTRNEFIYKSMIKAREQSHD